MSIILSPPGTGKTTWLNNTTTIFEDADIVLSKYHNCNFERENHTETDREKHYKKIDEQLIILKNDNRHIIGSLFWDIVPDAIVIIDNLEHKKRVKNRNDLSWDKVEEITTYLLKHANMFSIPLFTSFGECEKYILNHTLNLS